MTIVVMKKKPFAKWTSYPLGFFEKIEEKTAVILILNPDAEHPPINAERHLILSFWDRTNLNFRERVLVRLFGNRPDVCVRLQRILMGDNSGWPWRPPLADDARRIKEFVDSVPEDWSFIVLCEYGRSRSRAVAEWIVARRKIEADGFRGAGRPNAILEKLLSQQ